MANVEICSRQNSSVPSPNTPAPMIDEHRLAVLLRDGLAGGRPARETPRKQPPRMTPIAHQRDGGVARLGPPEGRHAVGDGLDAGQRDGTGGEGPQEHEEADGADRLAAVGQLRRAPAPGPGMGPRSAKKIRYSPTPMSSEQGDDVDVGGPGEEPTRLLHAAQVGQRS